MQEINKTAFNGDFVFGDDVFGKVQSYVTNEFEPFTSSITRALFCDVIPDGNKVDIYSKYISDLEAFEQSGFLIKKDCITIFNVREKYWRYIASAIKADSEHFLPGYECLENVTKCYEALFGAYAYINKNNRSSVLFYEDKNDSDNAFLLQACFVSLLPWYLDTSSLPQWKLSIIEAISKNNIKEYLGSIHEAYSHYCAIDIKKFEKTVDCDDINFVHSVARNIEEIVNDKVLKSLIEEYHLLEQFKHNFETDHNYYFVAEFNNSMLNDFLRRMGYYASSLFGGDEEYGLMLVEYYEKIADFYRNTKGA